MGGKIQGDISAFAVPKESRLNQILINILLHRSGFTMGLAGLKPVAPWQAGPRIPSKKIKNPAEIACILVAQALQMPVPKPGCSSCL